VLATFEQAIRIEAEKYTNGRMYRALGETQQRRAVRPIRACA
jgi:hypothetical protein